MKRHSKRRHTAPRSASDPTTKEVENTPYQRRQAILDAIVQLGLGLRRSKALTKDLESPPSKSLQKRLTVQGNSCPRCSGFIYRESLPFAGTMTALHCANCGWRGEFCGQPIEEGEVDRRAEFDYDSAQELIRTIRWRALRSVQKAKKQAKSKKS